MIKLNVVPK